MSRSHQYHQPNAPDPLSDGSDSDIDLDLQELDHVATEHSRSISIDPYKTHQQADGQIPLRNLRVGRTRRFGRQKDIHHVSGDGEDLQGLLNDSSDHGDSTGNLAVDDDAPLLQRDGRRVSRAYTKEGRRGFLSPRVRLSSFASGRAGLETPAEDSNATPPGGTSRNISIGQYPPPRFPPNAVSNAKYTAWSFLPRTLYNEFSFFFNMYFLLVALSQAIPPLRIGYLSTYVAPLAFVLAITLGKEALDDIARRKRDAEANKEEYTVLRLRDGSDISGILGKPKRHLKPPSNKNSARGVSKNSRLEAIEEEEEHLGEDSQGAIANIEVDEIDIKSRDLKVGDILKLG